MVDLRVRQLVTTEAEADETESPSLGGLGSADRATRSVVPAAPPPAGTAKR